MTITSELEYLPLGKEFNGRGSQRDWCFRLIKREGMLAIYEKRNEGSMVYEVVRIKNDKGGMRKLGDSMVVFEPKERYPSDEAFGVDGWSYGRLVDAEERFYSLIGVKY